MADMLFRGLVKIIPGVGYRESDQHLFIDPEMVEEMQGEPCRRHRRAWVNLMVRAALGGVYKVKPDLVYRSLTVLHADPEEGGKAA
jgi:hypothetical protein